MPEPAIELDGVTTVRDGQPVLHNLRCTVPAGAVTVLLGPSDSGKTTVVRHLAGLLRPDAGTIRVDGRDIWAGGQDGLREVRRGMSVLPGGYDRFDAWLFGSLSAVDNLLYGLEQRGVPEEYRHGRAMARLRELGLADVADLLPAELPGHARKRLALARTIVPDAPLTIVDEVERALDAAHSAAVIAALGALRERTGGTILLTTHDVRFARALADHVLVLANGRIVAAGAVDDVLAGVHTGEELDRRFRELDFLGPPRAEDVRTGAPPRRTFTVELPTLLFGAAVLVLVVAALLILGHLRGQLP